MANHEYKIHHHVRCLMERFGRGAGTPGEEVYTDMLLKNMTPYITTQVTTHGAKRKISDTSPSPVDFLQKYDEVKSKNVKVLDPLVYLLSKLADDEQTKTMLRSQAEASAKDDGLITQEKKAQIVSQMPESGAKMTPEELERLRRTIIKEASKSKHTGSAKRRPVVLDHSRKAQIPPQPDWLFNRPYLTMDFVDGVEDDLEPLSLQTLPVAMQESFVIDDLLYCMEGIEGKYIKVMPLSDAYGPREFRVDQTLDTSLRELAKRILPLCSNYSIVVRFIEAKSAFECGLVNHALCAAMRILIKDYMVLVAQLEYQHNTGNLSLQKMWFYVQPTMRTMDVLASIANSINKGECMGGAVLSLLHEKTNNAVGDEKTQELCLYLTQAASVPYFDILEKWIYKGIITDPYCEFLVEENERFQKEKLQDDYNDSYWEQHYTIKRERIPVFLESMTNKILNTGKYLNVVRLCGCEINCPTAEEIVYTIKERRYYDSIERAHTYASKLLLDLLLEDKQLMHRIRSLKRYLLLDQGDFILQFMDMAEDELKKPVDEIYPLRLESLLELALRTSTAVVDPYKDDLRVELTSYDLVTMLFRIMSIETSYEKDYAKEATDLDLSGLESFMFDYKVRWPVTLVLSRRALTRYQLLFRHLLYCKHVERQLCNVWLTNKRAKHVRLQTSRWYSRAFALRSRMLHFVQNFLYYMMEEVIEPAWVAFQRAMAEVTNLDEVLQHHSNFTESCMQDCMLSHCDLLRIVHKLMMVCVTFSNFIQRLHKSSLVELDVDKPHSGSTLQAAQTSRDRKSDKTMRSATVRVVEELMEDIAVSEDYEATIQNFDRNFSTLLIQLLDRILDEGNSSTEHKLLNILYRLDFNGFYTQQLEALALEKSRKTERQKSRKREKQISSRSSSSSGSTRSIRTLPVPPRDDHQ